MTKKENKKKKIDVPVEEGGVKKPSRKVKEIKPPAALKPGVEWSGEEVEVTSEPLNSPNPDWEQILEDWGYDPDVYEIVEPVKVSQWDAQGPDGAVQTLWSYKAGVKTRSKIKDVDFNELVKDIRRHKKPKQPPPSGDQTFLAMISDTQLGKALADDTPILTTNGWTTHGQLKPGDYVYGADGNPKEVFSVTGSTMQDCYEVEFDHGIKLIASGNHIWQGYRQYKNNPYAGYFDRDLKWTTKEIYENITKDDRGYNIRSFFIDLPNALEIEESENLPIDPYVLGVWLGDGNSRSGWITSSEKDSIHWLESINNSYLMENRKEKTVDLRIKDLTKALKKSNLLGNKHVPYEYLFTSSLNRLALLQGLLDTDGFSSPDGYVEFCNTNRQISESVQFLAESFGFKTSWSEKIGTIYGEKKQRAFYVRFTPDIDRKYSNVFRMERKLNNLTHKKKEVSKRYIQNIKYIGQRSAQCITVEDSLYLAGKNLVITHNSDGYGVRGTVDRILAAIDGVEDRIKELRKCGRQLGHLVVAGMGDLIEQCSANYNAQTFTVEVNRRQQVRLARRLIRDAIIRWAKFFEKVTVIAVPGNHGENRNDGKLYTTVGDNDDVAIFETIADILSSNQDAYGHIQFFLPEDDLYVVLDLHGIYVGFAHGHINAGGSSTAQKRIRTWWEGQCFGNQPIGDAKILVTGHYHHFSITEFGDKVHIQCPAMDGGSEWWQNLKGEQARPGILTMVVDKNGYQDVQII